ncbi:hypothetical protein O6H91_10G082300 [Diphasiastrum complanatum]|uniref:Uncharacterized protein n=1 Tax=Diphasiastrum complanatum TaxID=34168 RepID=A0ACC2CIV9_DIPCM|nr:hypothetical protein O6H91_10G082300 [Diphasiastrum complanatum]
MAIHRVMAIVTAVAVQSESITRLLAFSVLPIAKVLVMCSMGLLMATSYINILSPSSRKQLSKLVFSLFLPCLIFAQLGVAVTLDNIINWWFIPVNVMLASFLGCLLGWIVAILVKPPPQFFKFTIVMIGIGNIGNIPLVLIGALCRDDSNPFGSPDVCNTAGVAYISFGQWVGAVIVYTFVFDMLSPPRDAIDEDLKAVKVSNERGSEASTPLLHLPDEESQALVGRKPKVLELIKIWIVKYRIQQFLQPPVVASLLAIIMGVIPPVKDLFFEDQAVFYFLTDSLNIMGGAMVPCIMLVLGGNLVKGPGTSELGLRTTVVITFVRLFVTPLLGLGVVLSADKLGLLPPNDKMFRFVLLLQHTMPTSILAGAVASLRGHGEKEASAILFWEHILSIISIAGWLVLYLNVLF